MAEDGSAALEESGALPGGWGWRQSKALCRSRPEVRWGKAG